MELEDIVGIELHDLPLEGIFINYSKNNLQFIVSCYDDDKEVYNERTLVFNNVIDLLLQGTVLATESDKTEINWSTLEKTVDGFKTEIIVLQGSSMPSFSLKFAFLSVLVLE